MIRKLARIAIAAALLGAYPLFVVAQTFEGALPGTSGHAVPFLDGTNFWSSTQTIGSPSSNGQLTLNGSTSGSSSALVGTTGSLSLGNNQGNQSSNFYDGAHGSAFVIDGLSTAIANQISVLPASTGNTPQILSTGTDTNVSLLLTPQGTGVVSSAAEIQGKFFNASTPGTGYALGGTSAIITNGNYTEILSPSNQTSAAIFLVGNATDPQNYHRGNVIFQTLGGVQFGSIGTNGTLVLGGSTPAVSGVIGLGGSSSGTITIQPQAAAGTYNLNLPITAGTAGQFLTSQGGGSSAMTWTTPTGVNPQPHLFTSTFTTDPASSTSTQYYYRCVGGGGGGGGASGSLVAAGGGGSGGFMEGLFTGVAASVTVTITTGTAGSAGAAGGAGGNGGASTIAATGITTLSAPGGSGAPGNTTGGTGTSGGAGGSTFGGSPTVTVAGHIGQSGGATGSGIFGGQGASSPFASGGFGEMTSGSAVTGGPGGIGAGGAGGGASTSAAGGAGGAGLCMVMYWL